MNREIKFRAWTGESIYHIGGDFTLTFGNKEPELNIWCSDGLLDTIPVKSIMQYTGLKDCNGVEIYEGDIVHYIVPPTSSYLTWGCDSIATIEWNSTGFYIKPLKGQGGISAWMVSIPNGGASDKPNTFFTVIGNIFENPELL